MEQNSPGETSLSDMYKIQDAHFKEEDSKPEYSVHRIGVLLFVIGLFLLLNIVTFMLPDSDIQFIAQITGAVCLILAGVYLLRKTLSVLKPLIASSFLASLGIPALIIGIVIIIESMETMETYGLFFLVISLVILFFGIPTLIASVYAVLRIKHRWTILGSMFGIVVGIIIGSVISDLSPVLFGLAALGLLIFSSEEFKD